MMHATTQVTVWSCVMTVPSCKAVAMAGHASTLSGCSEMERKCQLQTHALKMTDLEMSLFVI